MDNRIKVIILLIVMLSCLSLVSGLGLESYKPKNYVSHISCLNITNQSALLFCDDFKKGINFTTKWYSLEPAKYTVGAGTEVLRAKKPAATTNVLRPISKILNKTYDWTCKFQVTNFTVQIGGGGAYYMMITVSAYSDRVVSGYVADHTGPATFNIPTSSGNILYKGNIWALINNSQKNASFYVSAVNSTHFYAALMVPNGVNGTVVRQGLNVSYTTATNGLYPSVFHWDTQNASSYDEIYCWKGHPNDDPAVSHPLTITSNIDIKFMNNSRTYKSNFKEGEDFYIRANYTTNTGVAINDSSAVCNTTVQNALKEYKDTDINFTLCGTSCDYSSRRISFDTGSNISVNKDIAYFKACSPVLNTDNLTVVISCIGASYTKQIPGSSIPSCSLANPSFLINSSVCKGRQIVNTTVSSSASTTKIITSFSIDREYSTSRVRLDYNDTSKLWYNNTSYEYYAHGSKNISVKCDHTTDGYDKTYSELITVVNAPPVIYINGVITNLGTTLLDGVGDVIEYSSDVWTWFVSVSDDDLFYYNVTWYDKNKAVIKHYGMQTTAATLTTDDADFVDFDGNPFNISVYARDTLGNWSFKSYKFNASDTDIPEMVINTDEIVVNGSLFTIHVAGSDEYLWFFNLSCSNGINVLNQSIAYQSYGYINIINPLIVDLFCEWELCDGHTLNLIDDISIDPIIDNKEGSDSLTIDGKTMTFSANVVDITTTKMSDRYTFDIILKEPTDRFYIYIPEGYVRAPNSPYEGHYIDTNNRHWLDFENDYEYKISTTDAFAIIESPKPTIEYHFESIGNLNCIDGNFTITLVNYAVPNISGITPLNDTLINSTPVCISFGVDLISNCTLRYDNVNVSTINLTTGATFPCIDLTNGTAHNFSISCLSQNSKRETSDLRFFDVILFPTPDYFENRGITEFVSIQQSLTYIFLILLWVIFYLATFLVRGKYSGGTNQFLNIFQGMIGFTVGMSFLQFSFVVGFVIMLVSVATFLVLVVEALN